MKSLRVVAVICMACQVTNCLQVPNPGRDLPAIGPQLPIINGKRAPIGISPHQVSLQSITKEHFCSGSILNRNWILTAAHCLARLRPINVQILSGSNSVKGKNYHCTDRFVIHPYYNKRNLHNDVALIHLTEPIKFNSRTRPIEFSNLKLRPGTKFLITGWGDTIPGDEHSSSVHLLMGTFDFVPTQKCQELLRNKADLDRKGGSFCTFSKQMATCFGDSGSPVVNLSDKKLAGVVSFVIPPCGTGVPDGQANVTHFRNWINANMK